MAFRGDLHNDLNRTDFATVKYVTLRVFGVGRKTGGWRQFRFALSDCRRNSRLSLMYKSLHGLAGISTSPFRRSSKQAHSFSWWRVWRHILCLVFSNRSYSILVALLIGTPSRHLWSLVFPFIRSAVPYVSASPTPSNHTPISAVTGGNPWLAFTEELQNRRRRRSEVSPPLIGRHRSQKTVGLHHVFPVAGHSSADVRNIGKRNK